MALKDDTHKNLSEFLRCEQHNSKYRFIIQDIAAVLIGSGLLFYYLHIIHYSVQATDEAFYLTIPLRLLNGDRLVTYEWHLTQFSSVFQLLPTKIFLALTGSTQGIILFMRKLYCVVKLAFFYFLYANLRKYKGWGLAAVTLFSAYDIFFITTINYYNFSVLFAAASFCLLFLSNRRTPIRLFFAGIFFSCCVLNEPLTALIYFIYTFVILFFVFSKKELPAVNITCGIISVKTWLYITFGIAFSAVIFLSYIFSSTGITDFISFLPYLFTDSEYVVSLNGGNFFNPEKIISFFSDLGIIPCIFFAVLIIFILIQRKRKKLQIETVFLSASIFSVLYGICSLLLCKNNLSALINLLLYWPLFIDIYGFSVSLILPQKDFGLQAMLITGLCFSLLVNLSSDVLMASGMQIYLLSVVPTFGASVKYLKMQTKQKKDRLNRITNIAVRTASVFFACVCLFSLGVHSQWFVVENYHAVKRSESTEDITVKTAVTIENGPFAGIKTTQSISCILNGMMDDFDAISKKTNGAVYICGDASWGYLYLNRSLPAYSAYFVDADRLSRNEIYWELHPEKTPSVIYIPKYSCETYSQSDEDDIAEKITDMQYAFPQNETIQTDYGYIIYVK